jgi:serine phosphatase RsbU (regulator of sigma subunit)
MDKPILNNIFRPHKRKILFISLSIVLMSFNVVSQDYKIEKDLEKRLSEVNNDSAKIIMMLEYSTGKESSTVSSIKYAKKAFNLAVKNKFGNLSVEACEKIADAYWYGRNYSNANEYYFKVLKMADSLNIKRSKARAYYNIGWIKCLQLESFKDRNYLLRALNIFEKLKDTMSLYHTALALANTYRDMSKNEPKYIDSARFYYKNIVFFVENRKGSNYNISVHTSYAGFLTQIGRFKEAKMYLLKSCEKAKEQKDTLNYLISRRFLASLYFKTDSFNQAKKIFDEILPLTKKVDLTEQLITIYSEKSKIFQMEKNYRDALECYILFKELSDSVTKRIFKSDLETKETKYEVEKREGSIKRLEGINEISEVENKHNRYVIFGLLFIAFLIVLTTFNLFRNNKAKQKANQLLNDKNILIEEQKKAVEEKNLDITNSINYAKRIQEAILPAKELKYVLFPDAFVLFQPKDIVSGDFYWFTEKNGKKIIAAIDCTGHGVPGAFMSMIGNAFLHEAVDEKGITQPDLIFNELRNNIIVSLKQKEVIDSTKDGMDMALLTFNETNTIVEFAGANNSLWLIRNGKCIEFKGDKMPIGYFHGKELPFTNHKIDIMKGDTLYIFTDGYADQFGGQNGKKLKYKQFNELLLSIQNMSMLEQELFILKKFNDWKGRHEQVDDVCVIGIRV